MVQGTPAPLKQRPALLWVAVAGVLHACALSWPTTGQALGAVQVLALAVLAALWWRCEDASSALKLGWAFATAHGVAATWWLYISMHQYGGLSAPLAAGAVVLLQAALGFYLALALGLAHRCTHERGGMARAGAFVGAWLCAELARAQWFTGFPWGSSGYAHVDSALAWLAPYVGVYGMGAMAALLAVGVASAWRVRSVLMRGGAGVMSLAALLALSQPARAPDTTQEQALVPLTLLQGNVPQDEKYTAQRESALNWYLAQAQQAPAGLTLAPEIAIVTPTDRWPDALWQALRPSQPDRALMLGAPGQGPQALANSVLAWAGQDQALAQPWDHQYDKHHLVPFGEFIPPGFAWFVHAMNIPMGEFSRGPLGQPSWRWGGVNWAPNICYEDLFGEELAGAVTGEQAAHVLVNFSNIAWFGDTVAQTQHLNISRLRALELQRPMVRVTNTGTTALIDHQGRVVSRLPTWTREVLHTQVSARSGPPTWYARWVSRWGLWPLWVLGALAIFAPLLRRKSGASLKPTKR